MVLSYRLHPEALPRLAAAVGVSVGTRPSLIHGAVAPTDVRAPAEDPGAPGLWSSGLTVVSPNTALNDR